MRGYNDDLTMSLAIACWVRDTALTANKRDEEYREAFFNSMISTNRQFNTAIPGMAGYRKSEESFEEAKIQYQEYMWLIKG